MNHGSLTAHPSSPNLLVAANARASSPGSNSRMTGSHTHTQKKKTPLRTLNKTAWLVACPSLHTPIHTQTLSDFPLASAELTCAEHVFACNKLLACCFLKGHIIKTLQLHKMTKKLQAKCFKFDVDVSVALLRKSQKGHTEVKCQTR